MTEDIIQIAAGALTGSMLCVGLAKYAISRSLKDLQTALDMVGAINIRLAVISSKLETLDAAVELIQEHDRKIASLEARRDRRNSSHS